MWNDGRQIPTTVMIVWYASEEWIINFIYRFRLSYYILLIKSVLNDLDFQKRSEYIDCTMMHVLGLCTVYMFYI